MRSQQLLMEKLPAEGYGKTSSAPALHVLKNIEKNK
jgi:hypothetical protein